MSNMSYCRFQNTLGDFRECLDVLREMMEDAGESPLSEDELEAAKELATAALDMVTMITDAQSVDLDDVQYLDLQEGIDTLQANAKAFAAGEDVE